MNKNDFIEFMGTLDFISEQYNKKMTDGLKNLYWASLVEYELQVIQEAISRHIKNPDTGMYMPKIADIVKMMQGSTQDSALSAWAKVDRAVRGVGTQMSVAFDDPLIHRVIQDMGGWIGLGQKQENDWCFVAKEFENRYRGFKARNEKVEYPKMLIGLFDASNITNGYKQSLPVLIGNKENAEKVYLGGSDSPLIEFHAPEFSTFKTFGSLIDKS